MRSLWPVILVLLLSACSKEDERVVLVKNYWHAMERGDQALLKQVLADPEQSSILDGAAPGLNVDSYEVLDVVEKGVNVKFSRYCYDDLVIPTILTEVDGIAKVDLNATIRVQVNALRNEKTTKQYCYEFLDQPLQGVLGGEPWRGLHLTEMQIDFGSHKKINRGIYTEPCTAAQCMQLASTSLNIGNLDLSGSGGNFDYQNNVTIVIPPGNNQVVTQGSYRVSTTPAGKTKLEISFKLSEDNALNGYITF